MTVERKLLDIDIESLPFRDFLTSRYSMTVRIDARNTYEYAREHNLSFFNITLGCLLEGLNDVDEFKRRIIDGNVYEYEYLNAVTPILQPDESLRELEVQPPSKFKSLQEYNDNLEEIKERIEEEQYTVEASLRDIEPIANLSCIPWIDFDSMTNIIAAPNQLMPVISWGKYVDGQISVSLTASHIFIFGIHFKRFYENIEYYLDNPERIYEK